MIILLSLDSYIFARNICYGGGLLVYPCIIMAMELGMQWLNKILPIKKANILNLYRYREISRTACLQARNVCIWFFHTTGSPLDNAHLCS